MQQLMSKFMLWLNTKGEVGNLTEMRPVMTTERVYTFLRWFLGQEVTSSCSSYLHDRTAVRSGVEIGPLSLLTPRLLGCTILRHCGCTCIPHRGCSRSGPPSVTLRSETDEGNTRSGRVELGILGLTCENTSKYQAKGLQEKKSQTPKIWYRYHDCL